MKCCLLEVYLRGTWWFVNLCLVLIISTSIFDNIDVETLMNLVSKPRMVKINPDNLLQWNSGLKMGVFFE